MANETLIKKHMETLGISREDAIQLILEDEAVDRMTSVKQIDSDLTDEQRKNAKANRQADRKPTVFKFDITKRAKKENASKRAIIENVRSALAEMGGAEIDVTNIEREIVFNFKGVKYKITLSAPRS